MHVYTLGCISISSRCVCEPMIQSPDLKSLTISVVDFCRIVFFSWVSVFVLLTQFGRAIVRGCRDHFSLFEICSVLPYFEKIILPEWSTFLHPLHGDVYIINIEFRIINNACKAIQVDRVCFPNSLFLHSSFHESTIKDKSHLHHSRFLMVFKS